jgi:hypothetical protein
MFDLEHAIADWRREMMGGGIQLVELEELECHLRDDIEAQLERGIDGAEAFSRAAERIGRPGALSKQFQTARGRIEMPRSLIKALAAIIAYALLVVGTAWLFRTSVPGVALILLESFFWGFIAYAMWRTWIDRRRESDRRRFFEHMELEGGPIAAPQTRCALALALEEGKRLRHDFVGTEHLLLGLLRLDQGTVQNLLREAGVDSETIRTEIKRIVGSGTASISAETLPHTPRLSAAIRLAAKEARSLNHPNLAPEHLLLGLLLEGSGVAALVLKNLGIESDRLREQIRRILNGNGGASKGQDD